MSTTRSMCPCISSTATAATSMCRRLIPRFPRRQAARSCRANAADARRLVGPSDHAVSRSAHEAVPGNARRRWRPLAAHLRAAGVLGRAALRPDLARCGLGSGEGLDGRGAPGAARCRAPYRARHTDPHHHSAGDRPPGTCHLEGRPAAPRPARHGRPRRIGNSSSRSTPYCARAVRRPRSCSRATRVPGNRALRRCSPNFRFRPKRQSALQAVSLSALYSTNGRPARVLHRPIFSFCSWCRP